MSEFHFAVARISTAQMCRAGGLERAVPSVLDSMTEIVVQHLQMMGREAANAAVNRGSDDVDASDVMLAAANCGAIHTSVPPEEAELGSDVDIIEFLQWLRSPKQIRQSLVARPLRQVGQQFMPQFAPHIHLPTSNNQDSQLDCLRPLPPPPAGIPPPPAGMNQPMMNQMQSPIMKQMNGLPPIPAAIPTPSGIPPLTGMTPSSGLEYSAGLPPPPASLNQPSNLPPMSNGAPMNSVMSVPMSAPMNGPIGESMGSMNAPIPSTDEAERDWLRMAINRHILMGHRDWFENTEFGPRAEPDTTVHGK